ncbi:MAG: sulfite exporter TauE/SafE family protein, partial [Propionivibrio sp.]
MSWWAAYVALGLFTGFFAGMLGIGGGLVMVPTLTMMFAAQAGFP